MQNRLTLRLSLILSMLIWIAVPYISSAEPARFAVLGDMPYSDNPAEELSAIAEKINQRGPAFVIHYGDMKSGSQVCDDELLTRHRDLLYGLKPGAVFYTPGDNDWTDCDRFSSGDYDEMERLNRLRQLFFTGQEPDHSKWRIERQVPAYPENALWYHRGVQFAALHVVGTSNGRDQILQSNKKAARAAALRRERANVTWLKRALSRAADASVKAVVLALHADMDKNYRFKDRQFDRCTETRAKKCNPFLGIIEILLKGAASLQKPVLLVHGSTSAYCVEHDYGTRLAVDFKLPPVHALIRLNGPGDGWNDAVEITVEFDKTNKQPFRFTSLLQETPVPVCEQ